MKIIIPLISILIVCGCSSVQSGITPDEPASMPPAFRLPQTTRWNWHTSLYRVSEDHATIEKLPVRSADLHVNVNKFIEPPLGNHCLMIGKPQVQPDGTMKVKVILSHPFPNQPEYTGFDVRGTIMFQATRYWEFRPENFITGPPVKDVFEDFAPLYFSRAEDGGGQLLNDDGFSFYLWPGLDLGSDLPILNYSKGNHAVGPDPDSTINGFKLFTNDPDRRMFLVTETISRTYHVAPPDGDFIFGYVVDASWAKPTKIPVTDPKTDFPFWANAEDGYVLELEQLEPFKTGTYPITGYPDTYYVTRSKVLIHPDIGLHFTETELICPDIIPDPSKKRERVGYGNLYDIEAPGVYVISQHIYAPGTYDAPPGKYLAVFLCRFGYHSSFNPYPLQFLVPPVFDFIYLDVVEGDW